MQKTKNIPNNLRWSDVFPEWQYLGCAQKDIVKSMYFSQPIEVCRNYIDYCTKPNHFALEAEKQRIIEKLTQDKSKAYAIEDLCGVAKISVARCKLILDDLFKDGAIGREVKGKIFVYKAFTGTDEVIENGNELVFEFIKNYFPFKEAIYKKFLGVMSPGFIDEIIKKLKKTHNVTTTWDMQRKAAYYKVGGEEILAKDCHKILLLEEFKGGPTTMIAIAEKTNQRKSSLQRATTELIREEKVELYKKKHLLSYYCLAGEGIIWRELGL